MPRRAKGPRLYLDPKRKEWIIRDGTYFGRTGCPAKDAGRAERLLAQYIGAKYRPEATGNPSIADVLLTYGQEVVPHKRSSKNIDYTIGNLSRWWIGKTVADIAAGTCRAYAATKSPASARRDLETLRAACMHWHREKAPLDRVPAFTMPDKPEPRDRFLTRTEARRLRRAAMATPHLYRFIVIGLLTGSRSGSILALRWDWIDFRTGLMLRRERGQSEDQKKKSPPVRMGKALRRILKRWRKMDKDLGIPFVIHYDGKPVQRFEKTWAKALKKAKLKDVTPHTLRHTRATWLMEAGVSIWEAAGALGMTPSMLESVYGKQHPDHQKRAAEV